MEKNKIEQAKDTLREAGYYVDNLWCIEDLADYNGTEEQKLIVLDIALNNEATMDQVWYAMRDAAESEGLLRINETEEG